MVNDTKEVSEICNHFFTNVAKDIYKRWKHKIDKSRPSIIEKAN